MTRNLNLHPDTKVLGDESKPFKVIPSQTIYYNTYTYKIVFDASLYKENRSDLDAYFKLLDEIYNVVKTDLESKCSFRSTKNNILEILCYLRSYEDYKLLLSTFPQFVKHVTGPINDEHYKLLRAREYNVEPRSSYWYNKYDAKVYAFMPYRSTASLRKEERIACHAELLTALVESIPDHALKINNHYPMGHSSVEFYTKLDEFNQYYPFLKMMHNNWTFRITKCILYQK